MPLTGHLRELRNRVVVCVLALFVCCVIFLNYAEHFVNVLIDMGACYGYVFVYLSPQELLLQYFKVTLIVSVCACLPVLLYQLWAFARPGLSRSENLTIVLSLLFGLGAFVGGLAFAYKIVLPFMLYFLIHVSSSGITATVSVENYLDFLLTVFIIFGCIFEMPMVSVVLTRFGILKPQMMRKARKVAIVVIFVVAAIITPPDIFSQFMVAAPMVLLYEISIVLCMLISRVMMRQKARREAEDDEDGIEAAEEQAARK